LPYLSTLQAVREFRHQPLLEEALRERLAAAAVQAAASQEGTMFGEDHHDSIVQRGIDEALACRDMLAPAPPERLPITRVIAHLVVRARAHLQGIGTRSRFPGRSRRARAPSLSTIRAGRRAARWS
jgi:hypothetical protein